MTWWYAAFLSSSALEFDFERAMDGFTTRPHSQKTYIAKKKRIYLRIRWKFQAFLRRYYCSSGSLDTYFGIYYYRFVGLLRPVPVQWRCSTWGVHCVSCNVWRQWRRSDIWTRVIGPTRDDYRVLLNLCSNINNQTEYVYNWVSGCEWKVFFTYGGFSIQKYNSNSFTFSRTSGDIFHLL